MKDESETGASNQPVEIIEYDLVEKKPHRPKKKPQNDFSVDSFMDKLSLVDDVNKETEFKKTLKRKTDVDILPESVPESSSKPHPESFSLTPLQILSDQMSEMVLAVESQRSPEGRPQDVIHRCYNVRECPDHTCASFQALNPRCWYVAGETCGCRTHLGIASCFDCQVFQMATVDPVAKIKETIYYTLGMVKRRNDSLREFEAEVAQLGDRLRQLQSLQDREITSDFDTAISEDKLVSDLVKFTKRPIELDSEKEKEFFAQQKLMTEQLGSAYLQLQVLTTELEKTNKELELKVADRTEELRKSNQALREAIKKAQEADRLKSEFIANVSHELRTPLNSIIGFSKVLMSGIDGTINDTQKIDLTAIYNSGRHLLEIINSILDLSKIEAGKMELNLSLFEVAPILDEIVKASETLVTGKKVKIESRILGTIPTIQADATKIRQIIFNLVSNAAKFTEEGSITIQAGVVKNHLQVSVRDTGIGIEKDELKAIFERFRQVDGSSTRRAGGTGLGLSIARKFADMHNGQLQVESKVGKGSVFTMIIPLKQTGLNV